MASRELLFFANDDWVDDLVSEVRLFQRVVEEGKVN